MNEIINNFNLSSPRTHDTVKIMRRIHDRQPKLIIQTKKVNDLYSGRRYQDNAYRSKAA